MRTKVLSANQRIAIGVRGYVDDGELRTLARILKSVGLTLEVEACKNEKGDPATKFFAARRPVTHDIEVNE